MLKQTNLTVVSSELSVHECII